MKSELNINGGNKEITYPVLAKHMSVGMVVMFTAPTNGVVVKKGVQYEIGHYSESWIDLESDHDCWMILPKGSTITLEQE